MALKGNQCHRNNGHHARFEVDQREWQCYKRCVNEWLGNVMIAIPCRQFADRVVSSVHAPEEWNGMLSAVHPVVKKIAGNRD